MTAPISLTVYDELEQGSEAWLAARCGIVTASVVGQLITTSTKGAINFTCPECTTAVDQPCLSKPTKAGEQRPLKTLHPARADVAREANITELVPSTGDTAKTLTNTLIAERITGHVEPIQMSRAMERGVLDEPFARESYNENCQEVNEVGFMVRDDFGFKIGYSPDGVVGDTGLIEIKSRDQKTQLATILADKVPAANMAQLQCGLLVSGRKWIDYVSFCSGMPLYVKRVYPDTEWQQIILQAVAAFEVTATNTISLYLDAVADRPTTERIDHYAEMSI